MALATVLETATQKYFDKKLTTQIAFSSPEFFKIYEGANTRGEGGRSYVWHPQYARRALSFYGRFGAHTRVPIENFTQAELSNARCIASAVLDEGDVAENTGAAKVIELLAESLSGLKDDVVYGMAGKLWSGAGGLEPVGLQYAIATAANTYATIARGTYTWWDNNRKNASGVEVSLALMKELQLACIHDTDNPDLWVTDRVIFRKLYNVATTGTRLVTPSTKAGKLYANMGFEVIEVDGIPVVWSDNAPVGNALVGTDTNGYRGIMYCLNTKDIQMRFVPGRKMKRTEWRNLEAQPDVIACDMKNQYVLAVKTPRNHGVLYGLKEN